jgi:hypothetical protein
MKQEQQTALRVLLFSRIQEEKGGDLHNETHISQLVQYQYQSQAIHPPCCNHFSTISLPTAQISGK